MKRTLFALSTLAALTHAYAMPAIDPRIIQHTESSSPGVTLRVESSKPTSVLSKMMRDQAVTNSDKVVTDISLDSYGSAVANTPYNVTGFSDVYIENVTNQPHAYTITATLCTSNSSTVKCSTTTDVVRLTPTDWFEYRRSLNNSTTLETGTQTNFFVVHVSRDHSSMNFYSTKMGYVEVTGDSA